MTSIFKAFSITVLLILNLTLGCLNAGTVDKNTNDEELTIIGEKFSPKGNGLSDDELNIHKSVGSDTASLIGKLNGIAVQSGGGVAGIPVIRGLADDRNRIKVDGMDLISACGNHMNPPLSYISPNQVQNATLYAGISPVSVGGDSIGSTIIVNSSEPKFSDSDLAHEANTGFSWHSNGEAVNAYFNYQLSAENLSLKYSTDFATANNYHAASDFKQPGLITAGRRVLDTDEVGSSYYQSVNHQLKMAWQLDEQLIEVHIGKQRIPEQGWVNQRMDMTLNDSELINLTYRDQLDSGELEAKIYQEKTAHSMQFGDDKLFWYGANASMDGMPCATISGGMMGCAAGMPMDTRGTNQGMNLHWNLSLSNVDFVRFGVDLQRYELNDYWEPSGRGMWPNTFININDGQRDRDGLFVEWERAMNDQWNTQLGIRYEQVTMDAGPVQGYNAMMMNYGSEAMAFNNADRNYVDHNWDLTMVSRYDISADSGLEFGYGRKTRSANLYERYTWSTGGMVMRMINLIGDGNGYVGNLDLLPEVAHTLSMLWDYKSDDWLVKVSPHYTQVDNYIDAIRCRSNNMNCGMMNQTSEQGFVYLQYENQSARLYGIDLSIDHVLSDTDDIGRFHLQSKLSYIRGENRDTDDNLAMIMPLDLSVTLQHDHGAWFNEVEINYVAERDEVSRVRNEVPTDSYQLLNVRGYYQYFDNLRITYGIDNLANTYYEHPLAGAYIGEGKTMTGMDVMWGVRVPGKGRNVYLGVDYRM